MRTRILAALVGSVLVAGCRTGVSRTGAADLAVQQLLKADQAFSDTSAELGTAEAFYRYFAEDAIMLPAKDRPVFGRGAIRDYLAPSSGILTWKPERAEAARGGDLGYTWGRYELRQPGGDGLTRTMTGKYTSVWRREADGTWRVILDIGNADQ